jgi:hypothetical protein
VIPAQFAEDTSKIVSTRIRWMTNIAQRTLTSLIIACAVMTGLPAVAQEQTLTFQAVAHSTESHDMLVPGQPEHQIGIAAFRGLAIFPDSQIANHWYSGTFDFIKGSGGIRGYALWVFKDGAKISAAYNGTAKAVPGGGITFTAQYTDVTGTGRFANMRGEGTFTGHRVDYFKQGGDTYFTGTLKLAPKTK